MTDKEIKKLAKEHTEDALEDWCTENGQIVEPWHCVVADLSFIAAKAIQNLSKTHCIVEKSKVLTAYKCERVNYYEEQEPRRRDEFLHGVRLLESLFGKELFNGKEE